MLQYGFNFQWLYSLRQKPKKPDLKAIDFCVKHGFNFIRLPMDYRLWTKDFVYHQPDEKIIRLIDKAVSECNARGAHISLNLHRAPGYCVNYNNEEKHNLWKDPEAQEGFIFLWQFFAKRYKGISSKNLSFDLLNEPPNIGDYGMTREIHKQIMTRTIKAIGEIDAERQIIIDGLGCGHLAIPEMADSGVVHSGRGYQPLSLTHYGATWWDGFKGLPEPQYPGPGWENKNWNKESLKDFYKPWLDVSALGVPVHIGEFGCYNKVENSMALAWFKDILSLYKEFRWGYCLWNFQGPFGIVKHGRPGTRYEKIDGYKIDRALLELLRENRVEQEE